MRRFWRLHLLRGGDTVPFALLSKVFYAPLTSSGVGAWVETTDYGAASGTAGSGGLGTDPSCATTDGYVVCVGGGTTAGSDLSNVYFATLSSSGVGAWMEGVDYGATSGTSGAGGQDVVGTSCSGFSGSIICVGGYGAGKTIAVWMSHIDSMGLRYWTSTSSYRHRVYDEQVIFAAEITGQSTIISIGGNDAYFSQVWYAPILMPTTTSTTASSSSTSSTTSSAFSTTSSSSSSSTMSSRTTSPVTTSTASTLSQSTTAPATGTATSSVASGPSSGGGIPEFPLQPIALIAATIVILASYLAVRRRDLRTPKA